MKKAIKIVFKQDIDIQLLTLNLPYINNSNGNTGLLNIKFQQSPRTSAFEIQMYNPYVSNPGPSPYTNISGEYTANRFKQFMDIDKPDWIGNVVVNSYKNVYLYIDDSNIENADYEWTAPNFSEIGMIFIGYNLYEIAKANITDLSFLPLQGGYSNQECLLATMRVEGDKEYNRIIYQKNGTKTYTNPDSSTAFIEDKVYEKTISRGVPYYFLFYFNVNNSILPGISNYNAIRYPQSGTFILPKLLASNFIFSSSQNNNGITVIIIDNTQYASNDIQLQLEYSLDDENWFFDNTLTGQEPGEYTIYIRDQFGCKINTVFTILDTQSDVKPYHYIAESNSIDFSLVEDIDNCETFRNYKNSIDKFSLNNKVYSDDILFNLCDQTKIQLKTNYANVNVTLERYDGTELAVPVIQRTNNFNLFKSLDCNIYEYSPELAGIYFTNGNEYNNSQDIIDTFELNGLLPDFAEIGNNIEVVGFGNFIIQNSLFDENVNKNVILIQNIFVSLPITGIVKSTYNLVNFNVFEFGFIWENLGEDLYQVKINLQDDNFEDVNYISEKIYVAKEHENTLCIDYFNTNNRDVFYKYGITHRIRIPYLGVDYDVKDEVENNIGDFKGQLVKSIINKSDKYMFDSLTEKRRFTLILALSSEYCFINGINYVKDNLPEIEHIVNTNLAYLQQNMIVAGENYNSIVESSNSELVPDDGINLPDLIESDSNFLTIG